MFWPLRKQYSTVLVCSSWGTNQGGIYFKNSRIRGNRSSAPSGILGASVTSAGIAMLDGRVGFRKSGSTTYTCGVSAETSTVQEASARRVECAPLTKQNMEGSVINKCIPDIPLPPASVQACAKQIPCKTLVVLVRKSCGVISVRPEGLLAGSNGAKWRRAKRVSDQPNCQNDSSGKKMACRRIRLELLIEKRPEQAICWAQSQCICMVVNRPTRHCYRSTEFARFGPDAATRSAQWSSAQRGCRNGVDPAELSL